MDEAAVFGVEITKLPKSGTPTKMTWNAGVDLTRSGIVARILLHQYVLAMSESSMFKLRSKTDSANGSEIKLLQRSG